MLAFGLNWEQGALVPGRSNDALAAYVLHSGISLPILAQQEIDLSLRSTGHRGANYVIESDPSDGAYLDTYGFLLWAQEVLNEKGYKAPLLIAHPHHLPRVQAVAAKLGIAAITRGGLRSVWDKNSAQPWTRGPARWIMRELGAIGLYARRGQL